MKMGIGKYFNDYKKEIKSDIYRYAAKEFHVLLLFKVYCSVPGFKYSFWLRTTKLLNKIRAALPLYGFARFVLHRLKIKYGIDIPYNTAIKSGLYIGHFGGIVVNYKTVIGKNVNINQGVTIGETYGGKYPGTPCIGDNVYLGPGSFVIGGITIGNNVAIGANTVVNSSIPDNAVVVSDAGKIISFDTSKKYVVNIADNSEECG